MDTKKGIHMMDPPNEILQSVLNSFRFILLRFHSSSLPYGDNMLYRADWP